VLFCAGLVASGSADAQDDGAKQGSKTAAPATRKTAVPRGTGSVGREKIKPVPDAGTIPAVRLSEPDRQCEFPDIAALTGGRWVATWVERKDGKERVVASELARDAGPGRTVVVDDRLDAYHDARVVQLPSRLDKINTIVTFAGRDGDNWDIYCTMLDPKLEVIGETKRLTTDPAPDLAPAITTFFLPPPKDKPATIIAFQSFRQGNSDICLVSDLGSGWGKPVFVSKSDANDWAPSVAAFPNYGAVVAWDSYAAGDYDVMLRHIGTALTETVRITDSPRAEFHPSVAVDLMGRVWIAYDVADRNWGKDFSPGSGVAAEGSRGLHARRTTEIRAYHHGKVYQPKAGLGALGTGGLAQFAEMPHLTMDGAGGLWMFVRHWKQRRPTEIYVLYATRLTKDGWSEPHLLAESEGRNSQRMGAAYGRGRRICAVYAGDGRGKNRPEGHGPALNYSVHRATLPRPPLGDDWHRIPLEPVTVKERADAPSPPPRWKVTVGDQEYTLIAGDLHRHTDIRGHGGVDASILDTYRYAADAADLDFVATTDHNQADGGKWLDGLRDYQWSFTQKAADLYHHPPAFLTMYAYEHSLKTPSGHRNIIFAERGGKMRPAFRSQNPDDNMPENLWGWMTQNGQRVAIIPHTFAESKQGRAEWNWAPPEFEPVLEIYQGARSSYERGDAPEGQRRGNSQLEEGGSFAQDALAKGHRYGFIASSDHFSTHNSYAYLYVKALDRESVLEALRARRTYAASDNIRIEATMNGHMMGEAFELSGAKPKLRVRAEANNDILRIDVIRQGQIVFAREPKAKADTFEWADPDPITEKPSYYYVRVIQRDVEDPQGDPEMAWVSPFFVTVK